MKKKERKIFFLVLCKKSFNLKLSLSLSLFVYVSLCVSVCLLPQVGAADAEIKVTSGETTELKRSPFKAWSRSV